MLNRLSKRQSANQNLKARAKISKRDPKFLSANWNIKAELKQQAHAEMLKDQPEHENLIRNIIVQIKTSKCKQKY